VASNWRATGEHWIGLDWIGLGAKWGPIVGFERGPLAAETVQSERPQHNTGRESVNLAGGLQMGTHVPILGAPLMSAGRQLSCSGRAVI